MKKTGLVGLVLLSLTSSTLGQTWWDLLNGGSAPESLSSTTTTASVATNDPTLDYYYDINDDGICCECVPFYLCDVNKSIIDTGVNLDLAVRTRVKKERNIQQCTNVTEFCCKVPSANPSCMNDLPPGITGDERSCECVPWELCSFSSIVSDGSASTTSLQNGTALPNHVKCPHSLEVCCHFGEDPITSTEPEVTDRGLEPPTEGQCACVNPWLCEDGFVNTNGLTLDELNIRLEPSCAPPFVCCTVRPATPATLPVTAKPPLVVIKSPQCYGIRNSEGIAVRISGFKEGESQFGEYPWVGMILSTFFVAGEAMNNFLGGAILIHPRVMLTAAHKVAKESVSTLTIRVGEWDVQSEHEPGKHQIKDVERIIIHPSFNNKSLYHDVALIILKAPVILQPHIRSICMATSLEEVDTTKCVINGWGENSFGSDNYQTVMKSVELPIVPNRRCQAQLRRTRLGRWFRLHDSFTCAGGILGKDACRSDGGGPLACPSKDNPDEYLLVGITAWGIGCGEDGVPGVYASTIADRSWITDTIAEVFPKTVKLLKREPNNENANEIEPGFWRSDVHSDYDYGSDSNILVEQPVAGPNSVTENEVVEMTTHFIPTTPSLPTTSSTEVNIAVDVKETLQQRIDRERRIRENRRRHPPVKG